MTITQEKINDQLTKLQVNLLKDDYEPNVKKQLKTVAKQAQIKGFRPGMVPIDLVKKMYGNSVVVDELNKLMNDEVYKFINENKIEIIASPIPAEGQVLDIDINSLKDFDFAYEVAIAPTVDLGYVENAPAFSKYKIMADDKTVDEEILRLQKRYATQVYPENIVEDDILTFSIEELNDDGSLKEGGISTVSTIMPNLLVEDAKAIVMALAKQGSFEYNAFELMARDKESMAKNILNMTDLTNLDTVSNKFKLTLNNIMRSIPSEINEEFLVKVYGDNGPKSEAEMRASIKNDLEAYFDGQTDSYLVNEISKTVIENANFPLPDAFLKRWIDVTNENPITPEDIEKEYPQFAKSLRWNLVQRKVVTDGAINITEEEVTDKVRANVLQQLYSYGMKNMGEEWVEQFVQKQMADKKTVSQTREQLLEDKVLGYIKNKVTVAEKEVTLDEFKALVEKVN